MSELGIHIEELPSLKDPLLIAGFEGWGNALNISKGMAAYLIRKLNAKRFARINPDLFYRYDTSRPMVNISEGKLRNLSFPGGSFYAAQATSGNRDIVILQAEEPNLRWLQFVDELLSLSKKLNITTIISLGSMFDNVLHSDRIISAAASNKELLYLLQEQNVNLISYNGPTAIHSVINSEGSKQDVQCMSLWCHCPYYLQGTTHFGILSHLGSLLSLLGEFELDIAELDANWELLYVQLRELIEKNPEVRAQINKLRKANVRGTWASMKSSIKKNKKVINLSDFLEPK